jgi:hypothetical protein
MRDRQVRLFDEGIEKPIDKKQKRQGSSATFADPTSLIRKEN